MDRHGALGCELPKRVAVDAQIGGGFAGIHPIVCTLISGCRGPLDQAIDHEIGELAEQVLDQRIIEGAARGLGAGPGDRRRLQERRLPT
jgi:hypothetical protein